jgi:hypothetical protein
MEYRLVKKGKDRYGWIGHSTKNGKFWDDSEELENPKESKSLVTSDFLSEVVQDLTDQRKFELAGDKYSGC